MLRLISRILLHQHFPPTAAYPGDDAARARRDAAADVGHVGHPAGLFVADVVHRHPARQADDLRPDLFGIDQVVDAEFAADLGPCIVEAISTMHVFEIILIKVKDMKYCEIHC